MPYPLLSANPEFDPHRSKGVEPSPNFPAIEEQILSRWAMRDTFGRSIALRENKEEWVFYDGPPFANGLPHYGHLLTGYAKDLFPRFQTMRGKQVHRRFGWDTHGLPAELEAMKQLGLTEKSDIEKMGVAEFNAAARASVMKYADQWQEYVNRQARWVDFQNDYKTLDLSFMESVIWAFKELYDKGLVYEGHRVLPYCWKDQTPLSNHELRMDDDVYKMRHDQSVTVSFEIYGNKAEEKKLDGVKAIAWTTTPWTLPTNFALAVGPNVEYIVIETAEMQQVLLAEAALSRYYKEFGFENEKTAKENIVNKFLGKELKGIKYKSIFDYYVNDDSYDLSNAWQILVADYVSSDDGTGIVHQAPAYGEEDQKICEQNGIPTIISIDEAGCFLEKISNFSGMQVFEANKEIIKWLKANNKLIKQTSYEHSYPHCWRCRTPLIYKAVSSWFVKVTSIKDRMLELNEEVTWVPDNVKHGQFGNWLANARDWSISRNRYWGTPIPVWISDNPEYPRIDVYGSLDEIERDFGIRPTDLHRPYIDEFTRPNPDDPSGKSTMRRIEDVLDVWFDSGAMPFAQVHYPFENQEWFDSHSPSDFIVEYIGQTRGWFYTLHILSTALFDRPAYKRVVSHGIVLGSDGYKMSKSLRNYPDVSEVFNRDGSDAMRWFLMSSSVLRGGNISVTEAAIREGIRQFILPLWNTWYFFSLYANADSYEAKRITNPSDPLDKYILAKLATTIDKVTDAFEECDSTTAAVHLREFVEILTNWYVRRSRERFWQGSKGENSKPENSEAFDTLFTVLEALCRIASPIAPLICEEIWLGLSAGESIHLSDWPSSSEFIVDNELIKSMDLTREVVSTALSVRKINNIRVRQPLASLNVAISASDQLHKFTEIIADEINVKEVNIFENSPEIAKEYGIDYQLKVNARAAGPRIGKLVQQAINDAKKGNWRKIENEKGQISVWAGDIELLESEYELILVTEMSDNNNMKINLLKNGGFVALDSYLSEDLMQEGASRDAIRLIQEARKKADLLITDRISLQLYSNRAGCAALEKHKKLIAHETLATSISIIENDAIESELVIGNDIALSIVLELV